MICKTTFRHCVVRDDRSYDVYGPNPFLAIEKAKTELISVNSGIWLPESKIDVLIEMSFSYKKFKSHQKELMDRFHTWDLFHYRMFLTEEEDLLAPLHEIINNFDSLSCIQEYFDSISTKGLSRSISGVGIIKVDQNNEKYTILFQLGKYLPPMLCNFVHSRYRINEIEFFELLKKEDVHTVKQVQDLINIIHF